MDSVSAEEVAAIVNTEGVGQKGAALHFGVSQAAISRKLRQGGYKARVVYERADLTARSDAATEKDKD